MLTPPIAVFQSYSPPHTTKASTATILFLMQHIRCPEYMQCYFAKVLGQRSFWSTNQCSTDAVQIYPIEDFQIQRQMMLFKTEGHASKKMSRSWFDLTLEGVKVSFAVLNEIPKHQIIVLENWQLDLRSSSNRETLPRLTHFDHIHLRRIDMSVARRTNLPPLSTAYSRMPFPKRR